ncbi:MAG TPA: DUF3618 domain-containing protein [Thermoanaerobaculia bacterium]|jgi:hypothetical protein|nr:DUF3618 domain-containing protein [Thermoanaerobaculia bacterium]
MANLEDEVTGRTGSNVYADDDRGPGSREIRREIERTRSQMDRNLDALEQKLTPSQLALEAWSLFRGGSTAGASRLWRIAKQHPGPAAVIGVGLAWLMTDASKSDDSRRDYGPRYEGAYGYSGRRGYSNYAGTQGYGYSSDWETEEEGRFGSALHGAKDRVSGAASTAKHAVGDAVSTAKHAVSDAASTAKDAVVGAASTAREAVSDAKEKVVDATTSARERASELSWQARERARYQARQAQMGFWQSMEERPLAIGAAALALGVVAGLMAPSTRKENELMGETRDRLMERAKEVGEEALEKGKQVASVAVDTLKQEAERQDLTPEKLAEKVRTVATEATNKVKEEGKKQATDLKNSVTGDTGGPNEENTSTPMATDRQSELTPK